MSKHLEKQSPAWHAKVIAEINREFAETNELSETARRRRARLGLMLIWVKEAGKADGSIPHGMFGPWMKKNLAGIPLGTAGDYITEANSILGLLKWQNSEIPKFETPPHLLLIAKSEDIKGVEKERQKKLADVIAQQKHVRAVTQYKQVELKDDATVAKRGRVKGEGGATKEQRARAKQIQAETEIKGLRIQVIQFGELADALANDKAIGEPEIQEQFEEVFPKIENLFRYMQRIQTARKSSKS